MPGLPEQPEISLALLHFVQHRDATAFIEELLRARRMLWPIRQRARLWQRPSLLEEVALGFAEIGAIYRQKHVTLLTSSPTRSLDLDCAPTEVSRREPRLPG